MAAAGTVTFLKRIARIAAVALLLATALRLGLGTRWFSFYGYATVALLVMPSAAALVLGQLEHQGRRKWPTVVLIGTTAAAALTQIAFWLAFFHLGELGTGLGVARSMVLDRLQPFTAIVIMVLGLAWAVVLSLSTVASAPEGQEH